MARSAPVSPPGKESVVLRPHTNTVFALAAAVVTALHLVPNPAYRSLDAALWPARFRLLQALRGDAAVNELVVVEAEGEATPATLAAAVQRLAAAKARTIALDTPLRALPPELSAGLPALTEAVRAAGNVVLASQADERESGGELRVPPPELEAAAAGLGYSKLARNANGEVARAAVYALTDDAATFGWPVAVVQHYLKVPAFARVVKDGAIRLKTAGRPEPLAIPFDHGGAVFVQYRFRDALARVRLADLLAGTIPPEALADKLVVLPSRGFDGTREDAVPVGAPLSRAAVHGCVLATLLRGEGLVEAPRALVALALAALGLVLAVVGWRRPAGKTGLAAGLLALGWLGVAAGLLASQALVLPVVRPLAMLGLLAVGGALRYRFRTLVGVKVAGASVLDDAQAALGLGIRLMQQGRPEEAIKYFQKVAATEGSLRDKGNTMLALVLLRSGERGSASKLVEAIDVTKIDPDDAYELAAELESQGELNTAHTLFSKLSSTHVTFKDVHERLQGLRDRLSGFTEEDVADVIVKRILDTRFRDVELLGRGGMGFVFHTKDAQRDGMEVAVKVLSPFYANQEDVYRRFIREARGISDLEHPHIIKIYDVFQENLPYFSMEYLTSASLKDILRTGTRLPLSHVLRLGAQVCDGLAHAHAHGIVHRDMKPDNVMLDENHDAKVIDFGIAHFDDQTQITETGHTIGTPLYMSPEQVQGLDLDTRSDVYSFGMVLYELLVGRLPYEVMADHLTEPVPELPPEIDAPSALRAAVHRALQKAPEDRFPTIDELGQVLREVGR